MNSDSMSPVIQLQIPYAHHYDWDYFIRFQSARLINAIESINGHEYRRNLCLGGCYGFFTIRPVENGFSLKISACLMPQLSALTAGIAAMFDLYHNITVIEQHLQRHYPHLHVSSGIHIPGVMNPYEAGIRAICGQQISVSAATRLLNNFTDCFASTDQQGNRYFPQPQAVTEQGLAAIRMMTSKRNTLLSFSHWCLHNRLPDSADDLMTIKGIGHWTVNYIKLRAFNDPDIWMGTDLAIRQAMKKSGPIDETQAAPYKSYLTLHLWNNL